MHLALLICDIPPAALCEQEGDYGKIFPRWLSNAQPELEFTMDPYDVKNKMEYPPEDKHYDGIFITGSASSAYEDVEWINNLVDYVAHLPTTRPQTKLFGICFGHQIIGRAFGGKCVPNGGVWEVGNTEVALTKLGQEIFGVAKLNIQEMHQDHVVVIPSDFELLGSTSTSANQGMVKFKQDPSGQLASLSDIQIIGVQGHPEFTKNAVQILTDRRASMGIIPQEFVEDVRIRNGLRNDGVAIIGKAFWKILGVDLS